MEGAHRELCAGLTNGLGRNDTHRLANIHGLAGRKVAAIALPADTVLSFAGEYCPNRYFFYAGSLDLVGDFLGDLLIGTDDDLACNRVADRIEGEAADDAFAQRFDDLVAVLDRGVNRAIDRAAVVLIDHDVLGDIHKASREVTCVRSLERRIGQALASAVGGDEEFDDRQALAEVRANRQLDDVA